MNETWTLTRALLHILGRWDRGELLPTPVTLPDFVRLLEKGPYWLAGVYPFQVASVLRELEFSDATAALFERWNSRRAELEMQAARARDEGERARPRPTPTGALRLEAIRRGGPPEPGRRPDHLFRR